MYVNLNRFVCRYKLVYCMTSWAVVLYTHFPCQIVITYITYTHFPHQIVFVDKMSQSIDTNVVTYFCLRNHDLLWMYGVWKHCFVLYFDNCSRCITSAIIHSESVSLLEVWSYIVPTVLVGQCQLLKTIIAKVATMRGIARFVVAPSEVGGVLVFHLACSLQCSASSEVLGDDEGPPAGSRFTCSLALGGRNDDLTINIMLPATATEASFSDEDASVFDDGASSGTFEDVAVSPSPTTGNAFPCEYNTEFFHDALYESDSIASLLEGRFAPHFPAVNVPADSIVLEEGVIGGAGPDCSVNELFVELQNALRDELGIGRLSPEEKFHLDLLHILQPHRLPLNIFSPTLKFTVKVNASGVALSDVVPSCKSVMSKLFDYYSMHSLAPRQKRFLLPIAKRYVNMVYFLTPALFLLPSFLVQCLTRITSTCCPMEYHRLLLVFLPICVVAITSERLTRDGFTKLCTQSW